MGLIGNAFWKAPRLLRLHSGQQGEQTNNIDRAVSPAGRVAVDGGSGPSSARVLAQHHSFRRALPVPRAGLENARPRRHRLLGMALRYALLVVTEPDGGAGRLAGPGR